MQEGGPAANPASCCVSHKRERWNCEDHMGNSITGVTVHHNEMTSVLFHRIVNVHDLDRNICTETCFRQSLLDGKGRDAYLTDHDGDTKRVGVPSTEITLGTSPPPLARACCAPEAQNVPEVNVQAGYPIGLHSDMGYKSCSNVICHIPIFQNFSTRNHHPLRPSNPW